MQVTKNVSFMWTDRDESPQRTPKKFIKERLRGVYESRRKNLAFGWSVPTHQPYSPDLAPSDFYLFHSLLNTLNDKNFLLNINRKVLGKTSFLSSKPGKFYMRGINKLSDKWLILVQNNDKYTFV